ncbi:MAG: Ger(x)C family spore germination protein [bacterium]
MVVEGGRQVWIARGEGYTIFQAVRDMALKVPRRLYWAHCTAVIVGEQAARSGLTAILDFGDRDAELRRGTNILVVRGRAEEIIIESEGSLEQTVGMEIVGLKKVASIDGHSRVTSIHEVLLDLAAPGADPFTGSVEIKDNPALVGTDAGGGQGGGASSGGSSGEGQPTKFLRLAGLAQLRHDRLADFLDPTEARGLLWVRGGIASGIINVKSPSDFKGQPAWVALEVLRVSQGIEVQARENRPEITVKVNMELSLAQQSSPGDLTMPAPALSMERQAATVVANEIQAVVAKAKSLNVDPFAFGEAIHQQQPKLWKELEKDWPQGLKDLDIKVECKARIRRSALSGKGPQENP